MGRSSSRKKRAKRGKYKTPRPSTPIPPSEARRLNFLEYTLYPRKDNSNILNQIQTNDTYPSSTRPIGVNVKNCGVVTSSSMFGLMEDGFTSRSKTDQNHQTSHTMTTASNREFLPSPKRVHIPSSSYRSSLSNSNNTKHEKQQKQKQRDKHNKKLVTLGDAISEIDSMDHSSIAAATSSSQRYQNGGCYDWKKSKNNASNNNTITTTNTTDKYDNDNKDNLSMFLFNSKDQNNNKGSHGNQKKKFGISLNLVPSSSSRSKSKQKNNMYQMRNQIEKLRKRLKTKLHFQRGNKSVQREGLYDLNGNIIRDDFSLSSPITNFFNEKGFDKYTSVFQTPVRKKHQLIFDTFLPLCSPRNVQSSPPVATIPNSYHTKYNNNNNNNNNISSSNHNVHASNQPKKNSSLPHISHSNQLPPRYTSDDDHHHHRHRSFGILSPGIKLQPPKFSSSKLCFRQNDHTSSNSSNYDPNHSHHNDNSTLSSPKTYPTTKYHKYDNMNDDIEKLPNPLHRFPRRLKNTIQVWKSPFQSLKKKKDGYGSSDHYHNIVSNNDRGVVLSFSDDLTFDVGTTSFTTEESGSHSGSGSTSSKASSTTMTSHRREERSGNSKFVNGGKRLMNTRNGVCVGVSLSDKDLGGSGGKGFRSGGVSGGDHCLKYDYSASDGASSVTGDSSTLAGYESFVKIMY